MKNKYFFLLTSTALIIAVTAFIVFDPVPRGEPDEKTNQTNYDTFLENVRSGGVSQDGIPPIEEPEYKPVDGINFLEDKDPVFVMDYKNQVKIFPQKIMVLHEIVNDEIKGEKVSITYCPLTGSAIGYKGFITEINQETTFGTSGKLLNSNLVMYDRATESYIPQILGVGINGQLKGVELETLPVTWTSWNLAKKRFPDALVLTRDTGFSKDYSTDLYGSYLSSGNYYDSGPPKFGIMHQNSILDEKEVVVGVRGNSYKVAIQKEAMRREKIKNFQVNNTNLVAFYDESLDTVRVFSRNFNDDVLTFSLENEQIVDNNGLKWTYEGHSTRGNLTRIDNFDVMWFGWYAFFPDTKLITSTSES